MKHHQTEESFYWQIIDLAKLHGYMHYHTTDSTKSYPGFPDLVLLHPERKDLIFAELKTDDFYDPEKTTGKPTKEQLQWLNALAKIDSITVALWTPRMFDDIAKRLQNPHAKQEKPVRTLFFLDKVGIMRGKLPIADEGKEVAFPMIVLKEIAIEIPTQKQRSIGTCCVLMSEVPIPVETAEARSKDIYEAYFNRPADVTSMVRLAEIRMDK